MKTTVFDEDFVGVHPGYHNTGQVDPWHIAFERVFVERPLIGRVEMNAQRLKEFEHENLKHLEKEHGVEIAYKQVEGRIGRFEVIAD